jgi:hypothetical protein
MLKNTNYKWILCLLLLIGVFSIAQRLNSALYSIADYDRYEGKQILLVLDDFSGGINSKFSADAINDNESPELLNVRIDSVGAVSKRPSYSDYNDTALSEEIDSAYRYYEIDGTKNTLVQYDTALVLGNDATGAFTSKSTAVTDGSRLDYCTSHNVVYMTNESDTPLCYVGSSTNAVFEWGCQVADVSSTDSSLIDGSLDESATYQYKITYYYHGYEESNGSDAVVVVTGADPTDGVQLTSIPTGDARVTARKIYRTEGDGAVFYYLATIDDNTDTTYSDTTVDTSLDTATICPTDNGLPPNGCQWAFVAANRVFLVDINESKYYYSGLDTPDIFPALNYDYVFRDDGEWLKGYAYWKGMIYWFKNTYITATAPQGYPSQWATPKIIGRIAYPGTISGWSIQPSPAGIYYLSADNIYLFTGSYSQPIKEGIEGEIKDINSTYYSLISSTYWNNTYRLSYVSNSGGGTTPDKQIIWDEFRKAYVMDDKTITCYSVWNGEGDENELYAGLTTGVLIHEEGTAGEYNPFIHNTTTELETGTLTYVETGGTELSPTLVIDSDTVDTSTLQGNLLSDVQSITSNEIGRVWYNEISTGSSDAQVYIRAGNTDPVDGTWTDWAEIASSGDLPGISGSKTYLQYKAVLTGEFGDEKITNGTFTGSADGWTLDGDLSYSDGTIAIDGNDFSLSQSLIMMVSLLAEGDWYRLEFTVSNRTQGGFDFSCGGYEPTYKVISNGTHTYDFVCTDDSDYLNFTNTTPTTETTLTLDNISLKKMTTDNVSMSTAGGYFIKVDLGSSETAGESSIDFQYKTKAFDLRQNGLAQHDKTFTEYILEYDSEDTGTLYMDYWIDNEFQQRISVDLETYPKRYTGMFQGGAELDMGRKIQFFFQETSINPFTFKRASIKCEPTPLISDE